MQELQRKQRLRRIIYSIPVLFILTLATFLLVRGAVRVVGKERESAARTRVLEERAAALVMREQELKEGVANLKTEEGIREEIKERFNVTEAGEQVALIVDNRSISTTTDSSGGSWYKRLWAAIIGN